MDKSVGEQVKLRDPLTTRAILKRFRDEVHLMNRHYIYQVSAY